MRVLALVAALMLAMLAHAAPAAADDAAIDAARAALDKSDYPGARDALTKALAAGDNDRDALVEIHRMIGIVDAALGDTDAATTAFERMLALAPKATLPAGTSPKIVKPFTAAQAYAKKHPPLKIDATTAAEPPTVTVSIASDSLHMIERIRTIARVDGGRDELSEEPAETEVTFKLRTGTRIEVRVVALDDHGNRLVEIGSEDVPLVITGAGATHDTPHPPHANPGVTDQPPPPPPPHERSTIAKWWLWGGVAVVFGGVAGGFAYDARAQTDKLERLNADSSNHKFTEALAVEHRARRDVLIANIGFGVAGAAAVVATILVLTDHGGAHAPAERQVTATPVVLDGGGALVVEVPF